MFSPPSSKTSPKGIIFYLSMLSLPRLYKHFFKKKLFDIPIIEQFRTIEYNTHHWLSNDFLQIHHFQNQFSQNFTLITQTKRTYLNLLSLSLKMFQTHLPTVLGFSIQDACRYFPSHFFKEELTFRATSDNRHPFSITSVIFLYLI